MKCASRVGALILVIAGAVSLPAFAQYKWQTPEGTTVYSDVPPPGGAQRLNERVARQPVETQAANPELPFELKAATTKFPVVLYTAPDCAPCQAARAHLSARGVPFSEKTVGTTADFDAFKGLGFSDNSFPALTVGRDRTVGFESGAWDRLLNAAGYPRTPQLPARYRQAAAEPLTPPPAQRVTVTVQRDGAPGQPASPGGTTAAAASSASQRAIEQYRESLQAAQRANKAAEDANALRF